MMRLCAFVEQIPLPRHIRSRLACPACPELAAGGPSRGSRSHTVSPHRAYSPERRTAISAVTAGGSCIMRAKEPGLRNAARRRSPWRRPTGTSPGNRSRARRAGYSGRQGDLPPSAASPWGSGGRLSEVLREPAGEQGKGWALHPLAPSSRSPCALYFWMSASQSVLLIHLLYMRS